MKKLFFAILLVVTLGSYMSAENRNITFMTYNILGRYTNEAKIDEVIKLINTCQPEAVAIQEMHLRPQSIRHDFNAQIAKGTKMFSQWLPLVGKDYGISLFTKTEPISVRTKIFEPSNLSKDKEKRGMLIAEFPEYFFICTHYSLNADDRDAMSAYAIEFAESVNKTVFLAGDFNAKPTYRAMVTLANNGFLLLNDKTKFTFPADAPEECIDMVHGYSKKAGSLQYRKLGSGIVPAENINLAQVSDHLPVFVKIRTKNSGVEENLVDKVSLVKEGESIRISGLTETSTAVVYDINGREMLNQTVENDDLISLPSGFQKGVYILTLRNGANEVQTRKFIF